MPRVTTAVPRLNIREFLHEVQERTERDLDPALGSGIIVTFCTDAFGFFSFLGIATLLLHRLV